MPRPRKPYQSSKGAPRAVRPLPPDFDVTRFIGPESLMSAARPSLPEWPMYSFYRPTDIVFQAMAVELLRYGYSIEQVREFFKSTLMRHAFDGALGDAIERAVTRYTKVHQAEWLADLREWMPKRKPGRPAEGKKS